jgi:hypothetical protein
MGQWWRASTQISLRTKNYNRLKELDEQIKRLIKERDELAKESSEEFPIKSGSRVIVYMKNANPRAAYLGNYLYNDISHSFSPEFFEMKAGGSCGYQRIKNYNDAYDFEDANDIPDLKKFLLKINKKKSNSK